MKNINAHKENLLKYTLDVYRKTTIAGDWLTPLNPDNISIEFFRAALHQDSQIVGNTIYLNARHDTKYLFPFYVKELWHIKQKRENRWKYWIYKIFMPWRVNRPAMEQAELAANWLYK